MRVLSSLLIAMAMLVSLHTGFAAAQTPSVYSAADSPVSVELLSDKSALVPGTTVNIAARFKIEKDWHIYYKDPGETGRATTMVLGLPEGFDAGEIKWQKPHEFTDFDMKSYGYKDSTVLIIPVKIPADANSIGSGPIKIVADISWLSCKTTCVPGSAQIELTLPVAADAAQVKSLHPEVFAAGDPSGQGQNPDVSVFDQDFNLEKNATGLLGFLKYLAFAFIGGLILNLMPCVLPVVSMKIMSFVKEAGAEKSRVIKHGMVYAMGTVSTCLVLALAVIGAQLAGYSVGWGFQFQQPLFLLGMATLVTIMSLGLFGVFMVNVNSGEKLQELSFRGGYTGSFFSGVVATILSTPCTAPFLGTAIGFAFAQPWWGIMLIFASIGAGLAFPYVLLSLNPAWQKYIPKPGAWMEHFKQGMGFLFLFSSVWLLYVLGQQVGADGLIGALIFIIATSFGAWLIGTFADFNAGPRRKFFVWVLAAVVSLSSLWYFAWDTVVNPTASQIQTQGATSTTASNGIVWQTFGKAEVDQHLKNGKVVFLDFTAEWCQTCKLNEKTVLSSQTIGDKFKAADVQALKGDWTLNDPVITEVLRKFNRSGVPLYVVMSPHRPGSPIVLPELLTEKMVLDAIDAASKP